MLANFILPLAIEGTYTYKIPDEMESSAAVGMRALLPLRNKIYTGVLSSFLADEKDEVNGVHVKEIVDWLDETPIATEQQLVLWRWLAEYYLCTIGEVMKMALPAVFKLESETRVQINAGKEIPTEGLSQTQQNILALLHDGKLRDMREISKAVGVKSVAQAIRRLLNDDYVRIEEKVQKHTVLKTEMYYSLALVYRDAAALQEMMGGLKKAKKQCNLLQYLGQFEEVSGEQLKQCEAYSASALKILVDRGIVVKELREVGREDDAEQSMETTKTLNAYQTEALHQIKEMWQQKDIVLLHGVTSSGKTEVYIHLIEEMLQAGKQVLYLVPEIALTTQLSERLQRVFGNRLGVYHSRMTERERGEVYRRVQRGDIEVLLGVRSTLFLPFKDLGLVVVDEEHDTSYKQQDTAPRYLARTVAYYLAHLHHAKVLLGSATPSIETYYNARTGKIGLVQLTHRYQDMPLPKIHLLDLKDQYRRKEMTGHFSYSLVEQISKELSKHKQVILFQNRRGYASQAECKQCGYVAKCVHCDVTLTVHQQQRQLVCHYCGYSIPIPNSCPSCGASPLLTKGFGTEQLEEETKTLFPNAEVIRMDLDSTRKKNAYHELLDTFAAHKADILIGTQMVSKGLDFPDVSMVAILNADNLMNQPSFRAYEYAFQQLEQVSGRAGRNGDMGEVYIQTYQVDNPLLQHLVSHDYEAFYEEQVEERRLFHYPPFNRLLEVHIRHRELEQVELSARVLQRQLAQVFGGRCSMVITPLISKIYCLHERVIVLKIESTASFQRAKDLLRQCVQSVTDLPEVKAMIDTEVEPM